MTSLYNYKWSKARSRYLTEHPLCVECEVEGTVTLANEVDHKTPHNGDLSLFWDVNNWQSLCKSHHSMKTRAEANGGKYKRKGCDVDGNPYDSTWESG